MNTITRNKKCINLIDNIISFEGFNHPKYEFISLRVLIILNMNLYL